MPPTHDGVTKISILFLSGFVNGDFGTSSITVFYVMNELIVGCSDMLAPPLWSTISTVMGIGFTARQAIPICFFGFLICGFVIGLTSRIGAMYHVPFPVAARVPFGMWGCIPAILVRTFVALMVSIICSQLMIVDSYYHSTGRRVP
jgi:purine-cytosine permease-like protein